MARIGFGDIDVRLVGREPYAIRRVQRVGEFADQAAIGVRIIKPAAIDLARAALAVVSEIKSALGIEDEIIEAAQRVAVAGRIDLLELAGVEINALDAAAAVILGLGHGIEQAIAAFPGEAAGVADIEMAIGAKGRAIRAAAGLGNEMPFAIGCDAGDGARREFDDDERAIGQPDRAPRERRDR